MPKIFPNNIPINNILRERCKKTFLINELLAPNDFKIPIVAASPYDSGYFPFNDPKIHDNAPQNTQLFGGFSFFL